MIVMMKSSHGSAWTMYAAEGDKIFLVETMHPPHKVRNEAIAEMVRECRWMFGNYRIIVFGPNDDWVEILHDGTGKIVDFETYDGPVPVVTEERELTL